MQSKRHECQLLQELWQVLHAKGPPQRVLKRVPLLVLHEYHGLLTAKQPWLEQVMPQAHRANPLQAYRRRLEYHRDTLFSVSIACLAP